MSVEPLESLVERLCVSSRTRIHNVYEYVDWPEHVDYEVDWFMSPELCTLYGTELWELLDERARKRLAFYETVNFFSLNIRGESSLMQGLANRLYHHRNRGTSSYLHHFLDEENKHSVLFGTFCERYAKKVYPDRKFISGSFADDSIENDFLFYVRVLIFEELVDFYNSYMSRDARLHELSIAINRNHHLEEARHLAFGRRMCADLFQEFSARSTPEQIANMRAYLQQFVTTTWREYYNPSVYQDAGLADILRGRTPIDDPWSIQQFAWDHEQGKKRRREVSARCATFLHRTGILMEVNT